MPTKYSIPEGATDHGSRGASLPRVIEEAMERIRLVKPMAAIAAELGYSPNMLALIRTGRARLPLDKIPAFARAIEVDPMRLLRLWIETHRPVGLGAEELPGLAASANEMAYVQCLREAAGCELPPLTEDRAERLRSAVSS